ncbi:cytochrome o ubiquinol oxidase subunit 1 [Paracidovorax valerianellae]|uniref:Cytochrome o ubiquinol oxidase subunit 1 n=1 Tax=Paracidovorax valerianellae TaxID=187868 RepID=A0A1G6J131_9BURK|nr:cytochrome o ubiquinol oxidase subunit 1 [Paracidovorax valerianellae]
MTGFRPIHMPRNTWAGVVLAALSTLCGFALVWYMWAVAVLAFLGLLIVAVVHTFDYDREYYVKADEVRRIEDERTQLLVGPA